MIRTMIQAVKMTCNNRVCTVQCAVLLASTSVVNVVVVLVEKVRRRTSLQLGLVELSFFLKFFKKINCHIIL